MKKLSLILALILSLSFTGCGEDSKKDDDEKKTVSVSDLFAKKDKDTDKDKQKDMDDDDDKDDKDDKDDDDDDKKVTEKKPSIPTVKKESNDVVASVSKDVENNGRYKLLKEGTLPNPTFEVLDAGRLVLTSYKVVIPNYNENEKYILFEGTYTNLNEYDTSFGSFMSYSDFYQNGINLVHIAFEEKDVYTTVLTNATIDVTFCYILRDDSTPIEVRWGQKPTNRASYIIGI